MIRSGTEGLAAWPGVVRLRPRLLVAALAVVAPLSVSLLLVHGLLHSSLTDFVPAADDEMYYWHQVATFARAGFNGGYYNFEENSARLTFSHFAAHGPVFPMLYGSLGRLLGWERYSPVVFNLALVTLALATLVRLARPSLRQAGLLLLLLASFWPLLWELVSGMQEGMQYAVAIGLTAAAYRLLARPGPRPLWLTALFVTAVLAVSLMRPFWTLLLLPMAVLSLRQLTPWSLTLVAAACGAGLLAMLATVTYIAAPYPNFLRLVIGETGGALADRLRLVVGHIDQNLVRLVRLEANNPLFDLTRFQFLALLLALAAAAGLALLRRRSARQAAGRPDADSLFHLFNLGSILFLLVVLYIPFGYQGFRILGPYMLMTALLLVLRRRYVLAAAFIITNLLIAPIAIDRYVDIKARNFAYDQAAVAAFANSVGSLLDYQPDADGWSNTLLLDGKLLCYDVRCDYVTAIPAGRGVSVIFFPDRLQLPLKSKYLLLGSGTLANLNRQLEPDPNLEYLVTTPVGDLYLNRDCICPPVIVGGLPSRQHFEARLAAVP